MRRILWTGLVVFLCTLVINAAPLPTGKVTVKVEGEDGITLADAKVAVYFTGPGTKGRDSDDLYFEGKTDKNGMYSASSRCASWLSHTAEKEGYYPTIGKRYVFEGVKSGRWQPWDPTLTLVLKKVINPIPMYVKKVDRLKIPVLDQPVGYDLAVGDWVEPYGKGKIGDFLIQIKRYYKDRDNFYYEFLVMFSNDGDGIQPTFFLPTTGSELKFPREAPLDGYKPYYCEWIFSSNGKSAQSERPVRYPGNNDGDDLNWIFRVRSTKLPDGNIVGLYGKLLGYIYGGDYRQDGQTVSFTYYLNPSGTRNLEFNPEWNLFEWERKIEYNEYGRRLTPDPVKFPP